jgi:tetratricopeptide (TPR) repeat protein
MALCNIHMMSLELAVNNFRRALELDPGLKGIHYNIGHLYYAMKSLNLAVSEWKLAIEDEPGYADAQANLGVGLYRQGHFDKAVECFKRVIELRQDRVEDYSNLGLALARAKRHKEAAEQFNVAVGMDPDNPMLHSNLGLACYFDKQTDLAMKQWREVARLSNDYFKTRSVKQQSEFDESAVDVIPLRIMERAVHSEPSTTNYLYPVLSGFLMDKWELIINDEVLKTIPEMKEKQGKYGRALRALKMG